MHMDPDDKSSEERPTASGGTEEPAKNEAPGESAVDGGDPAAATTPARMIDPRSFGPVTRRELIKLAPVLGLGAFAIPSLQPALFQQGLNFTDWAAAAWFRRKHLAPTFPDSALTPLERFPFNSYAGDDPGIDLEAWTLQVGGLVARPGDYTLQQIQALPKVRQNTRHVCVEGWNVIGRFGGARLSDLLMLVGADTAARYLTFECADGYYESLDMATALHPQTLACYEMYDEPIPRGHGAPLRLVLPTKIGYKSAKYLMTLAVTNELHDLGYWEDQGYDWFYGQ
jgi:DMSO/TMAO reductase YedYZ molybdopterin-dependent catalytic subunit